jgi:hypothetical protein
MKGWVPSLLVAAAVTGCTSDHAALVVERQPASLADAQPSSWTAGSVIFAGDPQAFTFPQPVSLRFAIVDDPAAEMPLPLAISRPTVAPFGSGQLAVTVEPTCEGMHCTAELSVAAAGSSMVAIEAMGPGGDERACFYYAIVDESTDTDALRADLEAKQQDCRFAQ